MKKGKDFLKFIFTASFCLLISTFACSYKAKAANEFVCKDKETGKNCTAETKKGFFILNRFEVDDETYVVIPTAYTDSFGHKFNVEELNSNFLVSKTDDQQDLVLNSITLPEQLSIIHNNAFSKVNGLKSMILPRSLQKIGSRVFKDNSDIFDLYLSHYSVSVNIDGGITTKDIEIDNFAFSNVNKDKFRLICGSMDVYQTISDHYNLGIKITAKLEYVFHKFANKNKGDVLEIKEYYVNENISSLPDASSITPSELNFKGWFYYGVDSKTPILNNELVHSELHVSKYHIYPEFELKEIQFDLINNGLEKEYDATKDLITIKINPVEGTLIPGIEIKYHWYIDLADSKELLESETRDTLNLYQVKDSKKYIASISYEFIDSNDSSKYTKTIDKKVGGVKIIPHKLIVKTDSVSKEYGTYLTDEDIKYSISGLLGEDKVENNDISFKYLKTGDIKHGVYPKKIETNISRVLNNNENVISNYDINYVYGDYVVDKKVLDDIVFNGTVSTSFGEELPTQVEIKDTSYGMFVHIFNVVLHREKGDNVGTYNFNGIEKIKDDNYIVNLSPSSKGKLIITPKEVDLIYIINDRVYNKNEKDLTLYYYDNSGNKVYVNPSYNFTNSHGTFSTNTIVDAGEYTISVNKLDDSNYKPKPFQNLTFVIEKARPIVKYNDNQVFTYSGEAVKPVISIDNDEQTPIFTFLAPSGFIIENEECKNSGRYSVHVKLNESDNYMMFDTRNSKPITLSIARYVINLNPREFKTYYGDNPKLTEKIYVNDETLNVKYITNATKESDVGSYDITEAIIYLENGSDNMNYSGFVSRNECKGKVKVIARPVSINYYNYTNLVYDGNEKNVTAYLTDDLTGEVLRGIDIELFAYEGKIIDAGTYHLGAVVNDDRYRVTNTLLTEISVAKANYDMSKVKFNSMKYIFDFSKHGVSVSGELPEGVSVEYTIDGEKGNKASTFTHTVTANFIIDEKNYNKVDPITAIVKIDMTWLFVVIICLIIAIGVGVCGGLLYSNYRREHPRKIKLKIKNVVDEDLAAKRVATSVKEVLGDDNEKEEVQIVEDEDDLVNDKNSTDSFIERIYGASSELKYYYSEVKNELLSYEGITHTVDRKYEVFYHGTRTVAKLSICNNILRLYVNLDPSLYSKEEYNHRDMSRFECHAKTPLRINVDSLESLRHAKVFIRIIRKHEKLEAVTGFARVDYEKFYTLKEKVLPNIVKEIFKGKKEKKSKKDK